MSLLDEMSQRQEKIDEFADGMRKLWLEQAGLQKDFLFQVMDALDETDPARPMYWAVRNQIELIDGYILDGFFPLEFSVAEEGGDLVLHVDSPEDSGDVASLRYEGDGHEVRLPMAMLDKMGIAY